MPPNLVLPWNFRSSSSSSWSFVGCLLSLLNNKWAQNGDMHTPRVSDLSHKLSGHPIQLRGPNAVQRKTVNLSFRPNNNSLRPTCIKHNAHKEELVVCLPNRPKKLRTVSNISSLNLCWKWRKNQLTLSINWSVVCALIKAILSSFHSKTVNRFNSSPIHRLLSWPEARRGKGSDDEKSDSDA